MMNLCACFYSDSYLGLDQQYDLYLEAEGEAVETFYSDEEEEEMPEAGAAVAACSPEHATIIDWSEEGHVPSWE